MAKEYSYGVCIYKIENNKIFIFLNKTSKISKWNFFKGKQELNETIVQTTIREIQEETNLKIKEKYFEDYFFQYNKRKNIGIFLIDFNSIKDFSTLKLDKREIYSAKWLNIKDNIDIEKNQLKIFMKLSSLLANKYKWFYHLSFDKKI